MKKKKEKNVGVIVMTMNNTPRRGKGTLFGVGGQFLEDLPYFRPITELIITITTFLNLSMGPILSMLYFS